jgi:hypothetical protein
MDGASAGSKRRVLNLRETNSGAITASTTAKNLLLQTQQEVF